MNGDRARGNSFKLGRFRLDIREKVFTKRALLPGAGTAARSWGALFLDVSTAMDRTLGNPIKQLAALPMARGLELDYLCDPFQPKPFSDAVTHQV